MRSRNTQFKKQPCDLAYLTELLWQIDPDVGYSDWFRVLMVIFYATDGSEEGFELADCWSSKGSKYKGTREIRSKWRSFDPDCSNPVGIGTLVRIARKS